MKNSSIAILLCSVTWYWASCDVTSPPSNHTHEKQATEKNWNETVSREVPLETEANPEREVVNRRPFANAGGDQIVSEGETVTLDATSSYDSDGDPLTFQWRFLSKPKESQSLLSNKASSRPSFLADRFGRFTLELVVHDGKHSSSPDTMTVEVLAAPPNEPQLNNLIPNEATQGQRLKVQLKGAQFTPSSLVLFDDKPLSPSKVTHRNSKLLEATLDLTRATVGQHFVRVKNGSYVSRKVVFKIVAKP